MSSRRSPGGFRALLPPAVAVCETGFDIGGTGVYHEETRFIASAVPKRRAEFQTVRECARRAMALMGYAPVALLPHGDRSPRWPANLVGSLTHTEGYRGAAVARREDISALGIDAEPNYPLPSGVLSQVTTSHEIEKLLALAKEIPDVNWDRVLFSAKESVYKAWFPENRTWLDFDECEINFYIPGDSFRAQIHSRVRDSPVTFSGRWSNDHEHVFTVVYRVAPSGTAQDTVSTNFD